MRHHTITLLIAAAVWLMPGQSDSYDTSVPCLSYLRAERFYVKRVGDLPDHQQIEAVLYRLPDAPGILDSDPWQQYITTSQKLDWATERRDRIEEEENRLRLIGSGVLNYDAKSNAAYKSVKDAIEDQNAAGDRLVEWLGEHGLSEHPARLFRWFVGTYRENHRVHSLSVPDLVFRVAVYERQTNCPP